MEFGPELSKPAKIFENNLRRLTLLIQAPMPHAEAIASKLQAATKEGSPLDPATVQPVLDEMMRSLSTRRTILRWAIPMLVTFAEGYLEDAFGILIAGAFGSTALPNPIAEEITQHWIKNTIRSGGPSRWINQLKKFGVTGYADNLAPKLQEAWELRHEIIHSAEPDTAITKDFPLTEIIKNVGDFVLTTDAFILASYPNA